MIKKVAKYIKLALLAPIFSSTMLFGQQADLQIKLLNPPSEGVAASAANFESYEKPQLLEAGVPTSSHFYRELTNDWKSKEFKLTDGDKKEYLESGYDDSSWNKVTPFSTTGVVKSDISSSLSSEKPINPYLSKNSSVLVLRTTFPKPMTWDEREVYIKLGAIDGSVVVYVNGERVGFGDDIATNGVFNVTKYVKEGLNSLVVECYKVGSGSYLNSGDGNTIAKFVDKGAVYSLSKLRIEDVITKTSFDPSYIHGLLQLGVVIRTHYLNSAEVRVFVDLENGAKELVEAQNKDAKLNMKSLDTVYFSFPISNVKKWSSETPYLYNAKIRVRREMRYTQYASFPIGFRVAEVKDGTLQINGAPTKIKGVALALNNDLYNRERCKNSFIEMKKGGVNSIQLSRPAPAYVYELADSLGLYVWNQSNINGSIGGENLRFALGNLPEWRDKIVERTVDMYQSSKRYSSVILFSLGNECGNGFNMYEAYMSIKNRDRNALVIYPMAKDEWNSDIEIVNSANSEFLKGYKAKYQKPMLLSAFSAEQVANFGETWSEIEQNGSVVGGYLPSWSEAKREKEVVASFQNISTTLKGNTLTITNNLSGLSLGECSVEWSLIKTAKNLFTRKMVDKAVTTATLPAKAAPSESETFTIDLSKLNDKDKFTLQILVTHPDAKVDLAQISIDLDSSNIVK